MTTAAVVAALQQTIHFPRLFMQMHTIVLLGFKHRFLRYFWKRVLRALIFGVIHFFGIQIALIFNELSDFEQCLLYVYCPKIKEEKTPGNF